MENTENKATTLIEKRNIVEISIEAILDKFQFETGLYVDELIIERNVDKTEILVTLCASLPIED